MFSFGLPPLLSAKYPGPVKTNFASTRAAVRRTRRAPVRGFDAAGSAADAAAFDAAAPPGLSVATKTDPAAAVALALGVTAGLAVSVAAVMLEAVASTCAWASDVVFASAARAL